MYRYFAVFSFVFLLMVSCSGPTRFIVSRPGYEPEEMTQSFLYSLPATSLKVGIDYERTLFIPGPYAIYAQRMLGIQGAAQKRSESYAITGSSLETFTEQDQDFLFSLNLLEGDLPNAILDRLSSANLISLDANIQQKDFAVPMSSNGRVSYIFDDVTMESNVEMRQQTIYKTIITDTSFVRVPVTSEQMERKTLEKKAEEAAKLILEIRTDRYYLAAGLVDPFPVDFDLKTALEALDRLEAEYLSLFIGKSFTQQITREYFIKPGGSLQEEVIEIDTFSELLGLGSEIGETISLSIKPDGASRSLRNLLPQEPEELAENRIYYRIPELCDLKIILGDQLLHHSRSSVYQSGALVNELLPRESKGEQARRFSK